MTLTTAARYIYLPLAEGLREAVFQNHANTLATDLGVKWHHETDSRRTKHGWPDWYLCGDRGTALVELKTDDLKNSRLTVPQAEWLATMVASGTTTPVGVWRPRDWPFIHISLHRLAGLPAPVIAEAEALTRHRLRFTATDPHGRAGVLTGDFSARFDADTVRKALPDPTQAEVVACDVYGRPLTQEQP